MIVGWLRLLFELLKVVSGRWQEQTSKPKAASLFQTSVNKYGCLDALQNILQKFKFNFMSVEMQSKKQKCEKKAKCKSNKLISNIFV